MRALSSLAVVIVLTTLAAARASAQSIEVSPFAGVRAGGDLFEAAAERALDRDAAPVAGAVLNVDLGDGLSFEGIFAHQWAAEPGLRLTVDQWLAGGRQEFGAGKARPFLSGLLGLTRYAANGSGELRFTVAAGGGMKLPLQRHLAACGDSRVSMTILDADAYARACGSATCLTRINAALAWQIEFTGGLVVIF